jgi:CheY-like chemotaxis protein
VKEKNQSPESSKRLRVLVVDDDVEFLHSIKLQLLALGVDPLIVDSGLKAIKIMRSEDASTISAVLLDYSMPHLDGAQAVEFLREISPQVKVVLVTGMRIEDIPQEFVKSVCHVLHKPFRKEELAAALKLLTKT